MSMGTDRGACGALRVDFGVVVAIEDVREDAVVRQPGMRIHARTQSKKRVRAAAAHPEVKYVISAPIGLHPLMSEVIDSRVRHCIAHVYEGAPACDVCAGSKFGCELKRGAGMDST